jgi:hypothetical protein
MYRLAPSPLYLSIFFIAPFLASVIRAAISRGREYLAHALWCSYRLPHA